MDWTISPLWTVEKTSGLSVKQASGLEILWWAVEMDQKPSGKQESELEILCRIVE